MRDEALREHIVAYQRTRDAARIAALFDATAVELWQLAMHLAGEPGDADDLLQRTYLAVIENPDRYDPSRPAMGWMIGILTNKARELHRRSGRKTDPDRLDERIPPTPPEVAQTEEEKTILVEAVASLPELYRQVVELVLEKGIGPTEVASQLERSPGSVRVQLHRAIALLRRTLPPSLALPAVLLTTRSTGLDTIRRSVREAALRESTVAVSGAAAGTAGATKVAALAMGLGILGLGAWTTVELRTGRAGPVEAESPLKPGGGRQEDAESAPPAQDAPLPERNASLTPDVQEPATEDGSGQDRDEVAAGTTTSREPASGTPQVLARAEVRSFEFTVEGGQGFDFEGFGVVSSSKGDITFGDPVMEVQAGHGTRLAAVPDDHPGLSGDHSADWILRAIVAIDPRRLAWQDRVELGWPDPVRNVFFVECDAGHALVARVNWRWNPEREVSESLVRGVLVPPELAGSPPGEVATAHGEVSFAARRRHRSEIRFGGVSVRTSAAGPDSFAQSIEARRATQCRDLRHRLLERSERAPRDILGRLAMPVGILALQHAYSVQYDSYGSVGASFSFEHGVPLTLGAPPSAEDLELVGNDWSLVFDEKGHLNFRTLVDDRSSVWRIPASSASSLPLVENLGEPTGILEEECHEGDLLIVHTLDGDSDRWDLLSVLEFDRERWALFKWSPLHDESWVERYQAMLASGEGRIRRDRMRVKMRVRSASDDVPHRAFLDETVNAYLDDNLVRERLAELGYLLDDEDQRERRSHVRIEGGHVPPGKVFEITRAEWKAKHGVLGGDGGSMRVVLLDQTIVDVGGPDMPKRGTWTGSIDLGQGDTSRCWVEVRGSMTCEVELYGTWHDAHERR